MSPCLRGESFLEKALKYVDTKNSEARNARKCSAFRCNMRYSRENYPQILRRRHISKFLFLAGLIVFCSAIICHSRVFYRWHSGSRSARVMEALGGKTAYETKVNINGGKGQLAVFKFNKDISIFMLSIIPAEQWGLR